MAQTDSEDGALVAGPSEVAPVEVLDGAQEASQDLAATGSNVELPAFVDVVADAVDGPTGGRRTEVGVVGGGPLTSMVAAAVPEAVPDAIGNATDHLTPNHTTEVVETAAAAGEQPAGDNVSITLDDMHAEVEPLMPEEQTEPKQQPEQHDLTMESFVEGNGAAVSATATGAESGAGWKVPVSTDSATEEIVSDDMGLVALDTASAVVDDGAGSSEGVEVEPGTTRRSSLVVDELPQKAGASVVEDPSASAVSVVRPQDHRFMVNPCDSMGLLLFLCHLVVCADCVNTDRW